MLIDFYSRSDYSFLLVHQNTRTRCAHLTYFLIVGLFITNPVFAEQDDSLISGLFKKIFTGTETMVVKTGEVTNDITSSVIYTIAGGGDLSDLMSRSTEVQTTDSSDEGSKLDNSHVTTPSVLSNQGRFIDSK